MKKRILIVGIANPAARAAATARQAGIEPIIYEASATSEESVVEAARKQRVEGIYCADETHAEVVAAAAKTLKFPCFSVRAGRLLRNKEALRTALAKHTELNPRFGVADSLATAVAALHTLGLPAVVKPVDGDGGRGALIVRELDDAPLAFARAARVASDGRVLVEPYLTGHEYRVVCHRGNGNWGTLAVFSNVPAEHDHLFDRAIVAPVRVAGPLRAQLREQVRTVLRVAGGIHGVVVLEFMVSAEGLHLVELSHIGQMPGFATGLFPAISGIDLLELDVVSSLERPFDTTPRFHACGALWWLTAKTGIVSAVHGIEKARAVPGVGAVEVSAKVGTVLGHQVDVPTRDDVGYVLATSRTPRRALEKAQYASEYLRFETRAALDH